MGVFLDEASPQAEPQGQFLDEAPQAAQSQGQFLDEPTPAQVPAQPTEGLATRALMATPRGLASGFQQLQSAGEPNLPFPYRLGRAAGGILGMVGAVPPFAQASTVLGAAGRAIPGPDQPMGTPDTIMGQPQVPWLVGPSNPPVTPTEARPALEAAGEYAGGLLPLGPATRLLRRALPARTAPSVGVELPTPIPTPPRALPEIPSPVMAEQRPIARTLEAAQEQATGRALDLGEVGRRRAAQRVQEPEPYSTPSTPTPEAPVLPGHEFASPQTPGRDILSLIEESRAQRGAPESGEILPQPSKFVEKVAGLKSRLRIPSVLEAPPSDVVRGIPAGEKIVSAVQDRADLANALRSKLEDMVGRAYSGASKSDVLAVNKALDTAGSVGEGLSAANAARYQTMRGWFNNMAESLGLPPDQRIADYFPRIREQLGVQGKKIVVVGDKQVPVHILETTPKEIVKRWFEKERASEAPADDLSLDPIMTYIRGASHKIAFGGGKDPITGAPITSLTKEIEPAFAQIPSNLADWMTTYVNRNLGVPEGRGLQQRLVGPGVTGALKSMEFGRTIGGSISSPFNLLTHVELPFALAKNPANYIAAWGDAAKALVTGNKTVIDKLTRAGVLDHYGISEVELAQKFGDKPVRNFMDATNNLIGTPFMAMKNFVRAQAYYTGVREAKLAGLEGEAADQFAKNFLRKTQFVMNKSDMPLSFTDPNAGFLRRTGQMYKNYPIHAAAYMKNMIVDDAKDIPVFLKALGSGDLKGAFMNQPLRTVKFAGATTLLFGTDALKVGFASLEPPKDAQDMMWRRGLAGAIGMSMGHQVGLGIIPVATLDGLQYFLPGPLVAHAMAAASAGASLATGKDVDLSTIPRAVGTAGNMVGGEHPFQGLPPMDPEKVTAQITSSVPIAGTQLNRLRQAIIHYREEDAQGIHKPLSFPQALGTEPLPATNPLKYRPLPGTGQLSESARIFSGKQDLNQDLSQRLEEEIMSLTKGNAAVSHRVGQLLVGGKPEEAMRLMKEQGIVPSQGSVTAAVLGATMEPAMRGVLKSPKLLKGPLMEQFMRLPGRTPEE